MTGSIKSIFWKAVDGFEEKTDWQYDLHNFLFCVCYRLDVCVLLKFLCCNLILNVMGFGVGSLGGYQVIRVELSQMGLVPQRAPWSLPPCEDIRRSLESGRGHSPNQDGTLISDFQPPELWAINLCYLWTIYLSVMLYYSSLNRLRQDSGWKSIGSTGSSPFIWSHKLLKRPCKLKPYSYQLSCCGTFKSVVKTCISGPQKVRSANILPIRFLHNLWNGIILLEDQLR